MDKLCVDGPLLARVHDSLTALRAEFDAIGDREDDVADDWGSRDIREAVGDFVGNWDDNRRRIATVLQSTADMTRTCMTRFDEVDQALSQRLPR